MWLVSFATVISYGPAQSSEWRTPTYPVVSWTQASNHIGQHVTVEGTIVHIYYYFFQFYYDGAYFLVFHQPGQGYFYAVILSSDSGNFKCTIINFYLNKVVRITGTIQLWHGAPLIVVSGPSQIEVAYQGFPCS
jgi:hypothetical protein